MVVDFVLYTFFVKPVMQMKEQYSLSEEPFASKLFVPHDFVIMHIKFTKNDLVFVFEDDVTYHDGIKELFPNIKSLILRFHLIDKKLFVYQEKRKRFSWQKHGFYELDERKLPDLCKKGLEYLDHLFSYQSQSVMIELWTFSGEIRIKANVNFIEYEWI